MEVFYALVFATLLRGSFGEVTDQLYYSPLESQYMTGRSAHQMVPLISNAPQHQILHTREPSSTATETHQNNFTVDKFLGALNDITEHHDTRTSGRDDYPSYGYTRPQRPFVSMSPISESSFAAPPPLPVKPIPKPDLISLVKPVASKVVSKFSGLLGVLLTLLTGSTSDVDLTGLADVVINGVVKPLMSAKSGIKALISKITIPLIALLLINLEVLVTVWWLWEDCQPSPAPVAANSASYSGTSGSTNFARPSYAYSPYR